MPCRSPFGLAFIVGVHYHYLPGFACLAFGVTPASVYTRLPGLACDCGAAANIRATYRLPFNSGDFAPTSARHRRTLFTVGASLLRVTIRAAAARVQRLSVALAYSWFRVAALLCSRRIPIFSNLKVDSPFTLICSHFLCISSVLIFTTRLCLLAMFSWRYQPYSLA